MYQILIAKRNSWDLKIRINKIISTSSKDGNLNESGDEDLASEFKNI
jgi:hypothetical protein